MKRKAVLGISVDSLPAIGGVSLLSHHLMNEFSTEANANIFMGPKGSHIPRDLKRLYGLIEDTKSDIQNRSSMASTTEDARIKTLVKEICHKNRIDSIVLFHPFYYGYGAMQAAKDIEVDCYLYLHGYEFLSQVISPDQSENSLAWKLWETIQGCTALFCNSTFTKSKIMQKFPSKNVYAVGCGIDDDLAAFASTNRDRINKGKSSFSTTDPFTATMPPIVVAYLGRLVPNKRVERLVDIASKSQKIGAIIIGDGPERSKLTEQARKQGISDRVFIAGKVSEKRKQELLLKSDFICLLSDYNQKTGHVEGFGIALIEGIAHGLVPISSNKGGMIDIVQDGHNGIVLIDNLSPLKCAEIIEDIYLDKFKYTNLLESARQDVLREFTWARVAQKINDIIYS